MQASAGKTSADFQPELLPLFKKVSSVALSVSDRILCRFEHAGYHAAEL